MQHDDLLSDELAAIFRARPAVEWEQDLERVDVACVVAAPGPVEANFMDEGSVGRACGLVTEVTHPTLDEHPRLTPLVTMSRSASVAGAGSLVGEQTVAVLGELGYDEKHISALQAAGVIGS
jgi:crotonobetainyl-CoA:carnitine CoA-transferase CaiB-like acyl-CoA transferase